MADMKLPKRNYLDVIFALFEPMWDKIKNNTFINMFFPLKEVSEGNTEAILPAVVPGAQAVKTVGKPLYVYSAKTLGAKIGRGRPASNINENTGSPITADDIIKAILDNGLIRYINTSEKEIKSIAKMEQANKRANYVLAIESLAKKDATKVDKSRPRRLYTKHKVEVLGSSENPLLTSQINAQKEFQYDPRKSAESNWNRFLNEMQTKFRFTKKEAEKIFNDNFSQYFKSGGKMKTKENKENKTFLEKYFDFMDRIEGINQTPEEKFIKYRVFGIPTNAQKAERLNAQIKLDLKNTITGQDIKNLWETLFAPDSVINQKTINYLKLFNEQTR